MTRTKFRPAKGTRCAVCDQNGRQCRREAVILEYYHGDDGLYSHFDDNPRTWVRVGFCEKHSTPKREPR